MKVGVALTMLGGGSPDATVVHQHLRLGDTVEEQGFDSLFVFEHHFTSYILSPSPFQLLSYFAGRTKRVQLGTSVVVLPWHDPFRVAEECSMLDILSNGRCLIGVGKGASPREYAGFGIPLDEAEDRFRTAAGSLVEILRSGSFRQEVSRAEQRHHQIRPRPSPDLLGRLYVAATSPSSLDLARQHRLGLLMAGHSVPRLRDLVAHRDEHRANDRTNVIVVTPVSVDENEARAADRALRHLDAEWDILDGHYEYSKQEGTAVGTKYRQLRAESDYRRLATEEAVAGCIVGSPSQCLEQIADMRASVGAHHIVIEPWFGVMDIEEACSNLLTFATRVAPVLQRDPSFCRQ